MSDANADDADGTDHGATDGVNRREVPPTEEGWYSLHDFRTVDWDAWRDAPEREREQAVREGVEFLRSVADPDEGASGVYSINGHKADLLFLHMRPDLEAVNAIERSFERTALAAFTERSTSFVSVTEASGYTSQEFFEADGEPEDKGLARYMQSRLEPDLPDADYVSFYPMDKRRGEAYNWYDLPFDDRAEMMSSHGDIGRDYAGKVTQIITSAIGFDDWEWGVTLFANDAAQIKRLLYEMRFDESSSRYAEFGPFYVGQRIPPGDLRALLAGERVPTGDAESEGHPHGEGGHGDAHHGSGDDAHHGSGGHGGDHHGPDDHGGTPHGDEGASEDEDDGIRGELEDIGVYAGQPHGEDVYAVVVYSDAGSDELFEEARGLRANFDHYDTHVKTAVYEAADEDLKAVASVWETESAADTAGGFLSDLPGVVRQAGDDPESDTWGTMGMFYTVEPDYREEFHEKFSTVGGVLAEMDGHVRTNLLSNREDENDMFIASRWDSREDAMAFFRSDEFSDTVEWGRDVLTDRPRHVFLA